jgi:predicted MFS family arabinose efflux permease
MFGSFSAYWTSVTFLLAGPQFHFTQTQIGLVGLAGALGVLFAPIAGRLGDRGHERTATGAAFLVAATGFGLTIVPHNLWAIIAGAILMDLAVQTTLVLGQRAIYALDPAERSRLNTLYIATFFCGGAAGSAISGAAYAHFAWPGVVVFGAALPLAAFAFWLTDRPAAPAEH